MGTTEKEFAMTPCFSGGSGYFNPLHNVYVNFYARNKYGSEHNTYPYFEDEDIEIAKEKAEKILYAYSEYDKLRAENEAMKTLLTELRNSIRFSIQVPQATMDARISALINK